VIRVVFLASSCLWIGLDCSTCRLLLFVAYWFFRAYTVALPLRSSFIVHRSSFASSLPLSRSLLSDFLPLSFSFSSLRFSGSRIFYSPCLLATFLLLDDLSCSCRLSVRKAAFGSRRVFSNSHFGR